MKSESNAHCLLTEIHSWLSAKGHCQSITFVQTRLRKRGEQETLKPVFKPGETSKWQEREIKSQRGSKVTGGYTTGIIWTAVKTNSLCCDGLHLKVLSLPFFFLNLYLNSHYCSIFQVVVKSFWLRYGIRKHTPDGSERTLALTGTSPQPQQSLSFHFLSYFNHQYLKPINCDIKRKGKARDRAHLFFLLLHFGDITGARTPNQNGLLDMRWLFLMRNVD